MASCLISEESMADIQPLTVPSPPFDMEYPSWDDEFYLHHENHHRNTPGPRVG